MAYKVGYLGFSGDGHLGRLNLSHSYYHVFGHDERNQIAGRRVDVRSNMAAVEASVDRDYLRFKGSFFFAQGDSNPTDIKGRVSTRSLTIRILLAGSFRFGYATEFD